MTRLEVDPDLPEGWQLVPLPKKAGGFTRWIYFEDEGMRFGSPESVAKRASPTPALFPQWVPPGYRRSAAAAAVFEDPRSEARVATLGTRADHPAPWLDAGHLASANVVALKRCKQQVLVQLPPRLRHVHDRGQSAAAR